MFLTIKKLDLRKKRYKLWQTIIRIFLIMKNFMSTLRVVHPSYFAGFVQSDGCFHISISVNKASSLGVSVALKFILSQHISALPFFKELHAALGVGYLVVNNNEVQLIVTSLTQIVNVILPLFDSYPLKGGKFISYLYFKMVAEMMMNGEHLTRAGLARIITIAYQMNPISNRKEGMKAILLQLIGCNSNITVEQPTLPNDSSLDPWFVTGLADGDGSFFVSFGANKRITVSFTVIQEIYSRSLLVSLINFFNCGAVYDLKNAAARYQVSTLDPIINFIIPHFMTFPLQTIKMEHFLILVEVCKLLKDNVQKTDEGFMQIVNLAYDMNRGGKGRKLTKTEYINLILSKGSSNQRSES